MRLVLGNRLDVSNFLIRISVMKGLTSRVNLMLRTSR